MSIPENKYFTVANITTLATARIYVIRDLTVLRLAANLFPLIADLELSLLSGLRICSNRHAACSDFARDFESCFVQVGQAEEIEEALATFFVVRYLRVLSILIHSFVYDHHLVST